MAAGKIFAISFAINAALGGGFLAAMSGGANAMRRLKEESGRVKMEQRQLDAAWRASQASIAAYRSRVSALTAQYQAGRILESQFRSGVRIAAQTMQSASMSASEYRANLQRLQGEMQRTQEAMQQMNAARAARASASTRLSDAKAGMMDTVSTAAMFAAPLIGAVETAANFEAAMSKVQAITRSNSSEMQALTENARMLGETTQFSATQAADAMSYLGMAGWNANQIIAGMPGLLALSAAGGTDLARTADIVSDDLTAFGLSADQAGHMADVFAVTVTRTNTNVEMLGETMKYAAPGAKAFGASMEETAALAGLMANSGIKASQAGTALRSGFLRLAGPPKQATKAMQELGMSMSDITAQQQETKAALESLGISMSDTNGPRKMSAILTELRDKTADLGQEEKLATLKMIFGTEAATGWLAVLDAGPETFNDLVDQMENCDGEAQKMAETMMNNAKGALIQLKSAMEGLGISVGNVFLPALTTALKGMSSMAAAASSWVKAHEGIVAGLGSIGATAAGLMVGARGVQILAAVYGYARAEAMGLYLAVKNNAIVQGLFKAATEGAGRALGVWRKSHGGIHSAASHYVGRGRAGNQYRYSRWCVICDVGIGELQGGVYIRHEGGGSGRSQQCSHDCQRCGERRPCRTGDGAQFQPGRGATNRRSGVQGTGDSNPVSRARVCGGDVLTARHCFDCHSGGSLLDLLELVDGRAVLHGTLESDHSGLLECMDDDTTSFGEPADGIQPAGSSAGAAAGGSGSNHHVGVCDNRCSRGRKQRGVQHLAVSHWSCGPGPGWRPDWGVYCVCRGSRRGGNDGRERHRVYHHGTDWHHCRGCRGNHGRLGW